MGAIAEGFAAFAQPLLDQTDGSQEQLQRAFSISQLCFNLALLSEDGRESALNELRQNLEMDVEEFDEFRHAVVVPMIQRHEDMFPLMHRRVSADVLQSNFSLPERPRMAERTEKHAITDRYAPCPCNSGRKFKFCCGKKGR